MILILFSYLFGLIFNALAVYLALLIMEKIGKKKPSKFFDRAGLAMVLASGATMLQLIVNAASMVYRGIH